MSEHPNSKIAMIALDNGAIHSIFSKERPHKVTQIVYNYDIVLFSKNIQINVRFILYYNLLFKNNCNY